MLHEFYVCDTYTNYSILSVLIFVSLYNVYLEKIKIFLKRKKKFQQILATFIFMKSVYDNFLSCSFALKEYACFAFVQNG